MITTYIECSEALKKAASIFSNTFPFPTNSSFKSPIITIIIENIHMSKIFQKSIINSLPVF